MNGMALRFCTAHCRGRQFGDPLADGTEQNVEWGQLPATTPWLPPGGSQELRRFWRKSFNKPLYCGSCGSPSWRPLQGAAETIGLQQPTGDTPSVSPFGLPAPSEREPRRLRRKREAKSLPYRVRWKSLACSNQWGTLPQSSLRDASSLREGAKGALRRGRHCPAVPLPQWVCSLITLCSRMPRT